ncbi:MAG: hypothetical protein WC503_04290 [Candidatus Shapirobacteria bacterium]
MKSLIKVENTEQKIILLCEMLGQISDGMWENARPYDHYRPWMKLKEENTVIDPQDIGVDDSFRFAKRNYNFANKQLLDIVGGRIILKINLYLKHGQKILDLLAKDHWLIPDSLDSWKDMEFSTNSYWVEKTKKLAEVGITKEMIKDVVDNPVYTRKNLNKDCKSLKKVFKTFFKNKEA